MPNHDTANVSEAVSYQTAPGQTVVDVIIDGKWGGGFIVCEWADGLFVYRLFVERQYRGNGVATALIKRARELAAGKPVYLEPSAFADSPMDTEQLAEWYERLGFKLLDSG